MVRNLKDAFYNAQFRVGQGIYTRAVSQGAAGSLTQANFESFDTFTNLVDDASVMNEFAGSQLLMEDVSKSSKGMETVASSQTAMDAVAASQTAMDAVIASQLALDTVVASQTAMDAVAASQTAMDAVTNSTLATTAALSSQYFDLIFSAQMPSETFYNNRTINPNSGTVEGIPYDFTWQNGDNNGTYPVEFDTNEVPSEFSGGSSLTIDSTSTGGEFENSDEAHSEYVLDVSDAENFNIYFYDPDDNQFAVWINGTKVSSGINPTSWTEFSYDVSGESGEITIGIGSNNNATGGQWYWTSPHLT